MKNGNKLGYNVVYRDSVNSFEPYDQSMSPPGLDKRQTLYVSREGGGLG